MPDQALVVCQAGDSPEHPGTIMFRQVAVFKKKVVKHEKQKERLLGVCFLTCVRITAVPLGVGALVSLAW